MDRLRVGRSIRALRVRLGWRQSDLAGRAGVSRAFVSKIERGETGHADLAAFEAVCAALGAHLDVRVRWRGEGMDRLLDEAHARLVNAVVRLLQAAEWVVALEVTFNEYGERGSIDVFAWHRAERALLVVEAKSVVADAQGTLGPLDRKARLAPKLARERGWTSATVSRLLVVAEGSTNRDRVTRLASLFDAALPARNAAVRRWIRRPIAPTNGLLFLRDATPGGTPSRLASRTRVNPGRRGRFLPA